MANLQIFLYFGKCEDDVKLLNITLLAQWFLEPSDSWEDGVEEATSEETQSPEPAVEDKEEEVAEEKSGSKNVIICTCFLK